MSSLNETPDLESRFLETARLRLDEMSLLVDAAADGIAKPGSLERLSRHFDAMAALGARYGFGFVSRLGEEGAQSVDGLRGDPDARTVARWRELLRGIRAEITRRS